MPRTREGQAAPDAGDDQQPGQRQRRVVVAAVDAQERGDDQAGPVEPGGRRQGTSASTVEDDHEGHAADEAEHGVAQHPPPQDLGGEGARPQCREPAEEGEHHGGRDRGEQEGRHVVRALRGPAACGAGGVGRGAVINHGCAAPTTAIHSAGSSPCPRRTEVTVKTPTMKVSVSAIAAAAREPDRGEQHEPDATGRPHLGDPGVHVEAAQAQVGGHQVAGGREGEVGSGPGPGHGCDRARHLGRSARSQVVRQVVAFVLFPGHQSRDARCPPLDIEGLAGRRTGVRKQPHRAPGSAAVTAGRRARRTPPAPPGGHHPAAGSRGRAPRSAR